MSLAHDVRKLIEARAARMAHEARLRAAPIDRTTMHARIAAICNRVESGDVSDPRALRVWQIMNGAKQRRDHGDLA